MTDEKLIEEAAKALYKACWDDLLTFDEDKQQFVEYARAALAVFREHTAPTDDGAPEPEWEWGYRGETLVDVHPRKSRESAEGAVKDLTEYWALHGKKFELVRRRPAGPWLPVEGEKP